MQKSINNKTINVLKQHTFHFGVLRKTSRLMPLVGYDEVSYDTFFPSVKSRKHALIAFRSLSTAVNLKYSLLDFV